MAKHAVTELYPKPNKHGLDYQVQLDLRGFTEAEIDKVNWNQVSPDFSTYLYIHFKYGIHRWLGHEEDYCVVCGLQGHEVSNKSAWYSDYNIREHTA